MFKKILNWFDGKKTVIGSMMLMGAGYIPHDKIMHHLLFWGGQLLGGVGITHKAIKKELK